MENQQQELDTGKMKPRNHNQQMTEEVPARIRPALGLLLEAVHYAEQTSGDCWEFAVELDQLTALGLTCNDFRWLVCKGLVEHRREVTLEGDNGRAFRRTGDLTFPESTCFILTDAGVSIARGSGPSATRQRFQYESQVLARLRHPGIAQIYEAGVHREQGVELPYFVSVPWFT
jgi:hypothetical protein